MKKFLFFYICIVLLLSSSMAQNRLLYQSYSIGGNDTSRTEVLQKGRQLRIQSADPKVANPVPGMAEHYTYLDYAKDSVITQLFYHVDEKFFSSSSIQKDYEFKQEGKEKVNGYNCTKYSIILF